MTLAQAKEVAEKIHGQESVPVSYRNAWGFFSDDEQSPVFITKPNAPVKCSGVFIDEDKGGFTNRETGEMVAHEDVLGKPFYTDDAAFFTQYTECAEVAPNSQIDLLYEKIKDALKSRNLGVGILMLNDVLFQNEITDELCIKRMTVLLRYLEKNLEMNSTEELAYACQEIAILDE